VKSKFGWQITLLQTPSYSSRVPLYTANTADTAGLKITHNNINVNPAYMGFDAINLSALLQQAVQQVVL
jgi:hypothetical protein